METTLKGWKWTALVLLALAALLALRLALAGRGARAVAERPAAVVAEPFRWPELAAGAWNVFRSGAAPAPAAPAGQLAARYRLAGVFLILGDPDAVGAEHRCAILDDVQEQRQILAGEGEDVGSARVVRVAADHVVLSADGREETLVLTAGTLPGRDGAGAGAAAAEPAKILETTRFGNRVGETRWEINKAAVLEYYREMMDNPERLAGLFNAMEPDRDVEGKVAGYRLNVARGEKDFYTQVGLRDGDVVRKVNSMRMTSQRRAEYFIGEFVQDRLGAVVIDVERDGQPQKLVYLVK
jgi:type II secretion system protein C